MQGGDKAYADGMTEWQGSSSPPISRHRPARFLRHGRSRTALCLAAGGAVCHPLLHGDARMFEHALAHPDDDETVRLVAVMLTNATLALSLMTELVRAQASGNPNKVNRVRRRLDRVLAAAQARAQATCNA